VPVIQIEAENFTAVRVPNNDGDTWQVTSLTGASNGLGLKAPGGSRTDIPGATHDAIVEYDVAFHDAGTYHLYVLCRGLTTSSDSMYSPPTLGAEPSVQENLPTGTAWTWIDMATYTITADDVNRPLTLQLGKRENGAEIDMLIFSPTTLATLATVVPEPSSLGLFVAALPFLRRHRGGTRRR
jgi:hypothetical protein